MKREPTQRQDRVARNYRKRAKHRRAERREGRRVEGIVRIVNLLEEDTWTE